MKIISMKNIKKSEKRMNEVFISFEIDLINKQITKQTKIMIVNNLLFKILFVYSNCYYYF